MHKRAYFLFSELMLWYIQAIQALTAYLASFYLFFLHSRYYECDEDVQSDYELQNFMNEVSADGVGIDGGNGNVRKAKFLSFEVFYKIGWPMTFLAQEITCTTRIKDPS